MIKIGRLTDYAVSLLTQMAHTDTGFWAASDLAERTGLSAATAAKILKQLAKAGLLRTLRGASGGYCLSLPPEKLSVAAIVEAMDGPIALTSCTERGDHGCKVEPICPMRGNWDKINRAVRGALETVSLADMALPLPVFTHSEKVPYLPEPRGEA